MDVFNYCILVLLAVVSNSFGYMVVGSQLGEKCNYDKDCGGGQTYCKNQQVCACYSGFLPDDRNQKCIASVGASCENDRDCSSTLPYSECYQGICDCEEGYVPRSNNKECLAQASSYRSPCIEPLQCIQAFGDRAQCLLDKCVCQPRFHFAAGSCIPDKGLGESCNTTDECFISDDQLHRVVCQGGKCSCQEGFSREENECTDSGSQVVTSLISMLACWLIAKLIV